MLTNCDVIEPAHQALAARFDHRRVAGKINQGVAMPVVAVLDRSPPSRHDFDSSDPGEPSFDEFDHALLRLDRPLGNEPVGAQADPDATPRGWFAALQPPPTSLAPGASLLIVQHPRGGPVALAMEH